MNISVQEIEPCRLVVHYEANAIEIMDKKSQVLQHFKNAPVPGNRPGKASMDAINVHYRTQIEESLKRALAEDAYHNTIFDKKLRPHGAPVFNNILLTNGKFMCEFGMNTKPNFELPDYSNLEIPKPHEDISVSELTEKMLQDLRVKFGTATPYTESDFVQPADNIIVDYEGSIDGEKVDNLCATGEMFTVGNSQLPQFDDNVLGMALNEVREFSLVVPENGLPSIVGKTIHFKLTLVMGSKITPCPLDDSLAEKMNKKSFQELREYVHGAAQTRNINSSKMKSIDNIATKLIDMTVCDVPNWMALSEAQYLAHNAKLDWATMQDTDKEKYLELANKNVKLSLVLDKIREVDPDAQLSDQEVFDIIKNNIAQSQVQTSMDDVIKEMNRTGYLQILMSRIKDEYALDSVFKKAKIVE